MKTTSKINDLADLRRQINTAYRADEGTHLQVLLEVVTLDKSALAEIHQCAYRLVDGVRSTRFNAGGVDAFMQQYDLSTNEGIALMCIAEALLRIPDAKTSDKLIRDKLASMDWRSHLGHSSSTFVNAATWALIVTGKIVTDHQGQQNALRNAFSKLIKGTGEPVIRKALAQAMKIIGKQFILGHTIESALKAGHAQEVRGYRYSYDMLGEAARTQIDADNYYTAYEQAIHAIGESNQQKDHIQSGGISVKLSALYPRYHYTHQREATTALIPKVLALTKLAKQYNIGIMIDAEEADRLDMSLDVIEAVFCHPDLDGWDGFGLALQAYQKRAWYVIDWLVALAKQRNKRFMVRLVKGAYWDSEIKLSQEHGYTDYPVFTRKANTDVSYLACAQKLLTATDTIYPQFATHNAYSVAAVLTMQHDSGRQRDDFEFQCLHGMGQALYDQLVMGVDVAFPCRIYAPVGNHRDLLPYLVRRLLENGANTSFVNRIVDNTLPIEKIIADPVRFVEGLSTKRHPKIPLPKNIYGGTRLNAFGIDLSDRELWRKLSADVEQFLHCKQWEAKPTLNAGHDPHPVLSPIDGRIIGQVFSADAQDMLHALEKAHLASPNWNALPITERAALLRAVADKLKANHVELLALLIAEAGKPWLDAVAEIREAIDFCRYYAQMAVQLPNDTQGRGVCICISPWNFPLAIFLGQVTAALVAGNCVLAKPAENTPLVAAFVMQLIHQAGVPNAVVQLIPGRGSVVGNTLLRESDVRAVLFTGSTETAHTINRTLVARGGYDVPFIAETGGQNAMIVDSSALPEQVIDDVIVSAFGSAGQRCSALRVLFLQEEIAELMLEMLVGAMRTLNVGDPKLLSTDIGPVIDASSMHTLRAHEVRMNKEAKLIYRVTLAKDLEGTFFGPCVYELKDLSQLEREVFGPILHVIRYKADELDKVVAQINATGYGLTMGIHSRIDETVHRIRQRAHVGNLYVNRNMTGAVVGVQPFGGEGLSGTGPKAGGPHYVMYLAKPNDQEVILPQTEFKSLHEETSLSKINKILTMAKQSFTTWQFVPVVERVKILACVAERISAKSSPIFKSLPEGITEEMMYLAVDTCRDVANQAEQLLTQVRTMPGPTGELNQLSLHPRGVVFCVNEENSSLLAAFAQVCAAFVAGNAVVVKSAGERLAMNKVLLELLLQAGAPQGVAQLVIGDTIKVCDHVLSDERIDVVMVNGTQNTALYIKQQLAARDGRLIPMILSVENQHYLQRVTVERTFTDNIMAKGGNAALLTLDD